MMANHMYSIQQMIYWNVLWLIYMRNLINFFCMGELNYSVAN